MLKVTKSSTIFHLKAKLIATFFGVTVKNLLRLNYLYLLSNNQIYLVTLRPRQLTQASFLQKNQTLQNVFLISVTQRAQSLSSLQKSEFLKLIISFFHYFGCQNWDQCHKMSGKNTYIYFFYFWFKNKQVWAEKPRKSSKNLKVAGNYPNI